MTRIPHIWKPCHDGKPYGLLPLMSTTMEQKMSEPADEIIALKKRIEELEKELARLKGMGLHENRPETFAELRDEAKT